MITIECTHCRKSFQRHPSQVYTDKVYCSKRCHDLGRLKHIYICELCETVFHRPVRKNQVVRFCSKACMYQVLKRERNQPNCTCLHCGRAFRVRPSGVSGGEGRYCSRACKYVATTGKYKRPDGPGHYYALSTWRRLRLEIIERDGHKCLRCGISCKDRQLHVNHIIPRRKGGTDDPSNLETLCRSCHKIVETERSAGVAYALHNLLQLQVSYGPLSNLQPT